MDDKAVVEKVEKEQIVGIPAGTLEDIVNRLPEGVQARAAKQADEFESPYIEVPDKVMVFDVSTGTSVTIDGIPNPLDIEFGDERLKGTGLIERREVTKQGLVKRYRFEVKINRLPTTDYRYDFTIVDRKEWEDHMKSKGVSGATDEQEMSAWMMRIGGAT